jgi:DNA-binding transcriptional ArsR family regulator
VDIDSVSSSPGGARWELYRVLAEPIRLRILALVAEEELSIGELAELLAESHSNASRHTTALKQAGLVVSRREGTRILLRLAGEVAKDAVVIDALGSGRALCVADGSLGRIAAVLGARDAITREFFARPVHRDDRGPFAPELGAYLKALAPLIGDRRLAVDAGTGDGSLLDVLAPVFDRVVAIDREDVRIDMARRKVAQFGYANVTLLSCDLTSPAVRDAVGPGASAVFASRMLHHAARPGHLVKDLAALAAPGGAIVVVDYAPHDDDAMRNVADLWLGFWPDALKGFAEGAGLVDAMVTPIPRPLCGTGPDKHLPWQILVAKRPGTPQG